MFIARLRGHKFPLTPRFWSPFLFLGFFFNVAPFILLTAGQQYITSGIASILNATIPIFTALLAHFAFADERLNRLKGLGLFAGASGIAVLFGWDALKHFSLSNLGQIYVLLACLCQAFCIVCSRRFVVQHPPLVSAAATMLCAALFALPMVFFFEGMPTIHFSLKVWGAVLYLGFIATGVAYMLYYFLIGGIGAARTSLVTFMVAPFAIVFSWLMLGETLPPTAYPGMALIFTGLVCMDERVQRRLVKPLGIRE